MTTSTRVQVHLLGSYHVLTIDIKPGGLELVDATSDCVAEMQANAYAKGMPNMPELRYLDVRTMTGKIRAFEEGSSIKLVAKTDGRRPEVQVLSDVVREFKNQRTTF
jgi:hypothetical protein